MLRVRTTHAGEVAVLSTWLCALLPWSVSVFQPPGISAYYVRFLPFRFLFIHGAQLRGERPFLWAWEVPGFVGSPDVALAAWVWVGALLVFLLPFGVSVAYYLAEDRVAARLGDPVRVLGGLLVSSGLVFGAATVLFWHHQAGTTIPVGVLFQLAFGMFLLRAEQVPADGAGPPSPPT